MAGPEIGFLFQFGTIREIVTTNAGSLTLNKLKELACDFINTKVSLIEFLKSLSYEISKVYNWKNISEFFCFIVILTSFYVKLNFKSFLTET